MSPTSCQTAPPRINQTVKYSGRMLILQGRAARDGRSTRLAARLQEPPCTSCRRRPASSDFALLWERSPRVARQERGRAPSAPLSRRRFRHPCLFRSPPGRAGYFCFGKSSQNHCAGMTISPTSGRLDSPALLAGRAPARTRTSLCSDSRAFPAHPAAMLGVMRRRLSSLNTAIHGLRLITSLVSASGMRQR